MRVSKQCIGLCVLLIVVGILGIWFANSPLITESVQITGLTTHENHVMVTITQGETVTEACISNASCALMCEVLGCETAVMEAVSGTFSFTSTYHALSTVESAVSFTTQRTLTVPLSRSLGLDTNLTA
ncbi:MAG: hypothetical protein WB643_13905, partial [Candidatus Bathyarchaeia archaeon]